MRDITIRAVLNGFVVTVGCQSVVFENQEHLLAELRAYLSDPSGTEARYLKSDHAKVVHGAGGQAGSPGGETTTAFRPSAGTHDLGFALSGPPTDTPIEGVGVTSR